MVNVLIEVVVDPRQAVGGSRRVRDEIDKTEQSADRLRNTIRGALAGIGVGLVLRELGQLADAYTNAQNRIRTVTESEQELQDVTQQLFQVANDTRGAFDATVEVYTRTALAAKDLGITQQQTINFTRSLNQAVALSGAASEEARGGLLQLSQGLASGALRGDELRSVLESLPVVADVIAKSLGVTRGELREMGQEGKITANVILNAFEKSRVELEERFAKSVPTIGQAFTVLKNNVLQAVGALDQGTHASALFAELIVFLAKNLDVAAGGVFVIAAAIASAYLPATITATTATAALIAKVVALNAAGILSAGAFAAIGAAAAIAANRIAVEFEAAQKRINDATEAGEKFALTDYGKVGADILRVRENLALVTAAIQRDQAAGRDASETQLSLQTRYQKQLEALTIAQQHLADGTAKSATEAKAQAKAIEDTQKAVDKSIASIQQENALLRLGTRERDVQAEVLDRIAKIEKEQGAGTVTAEQRAAITSTVEQNRALRDRAEALQSVVGPTEQFEQRVRALDGLLKEGTITQDQFNAAVEALARDADGLDLSKLNLQGIDFSGVDTGGLEAFLQKMQLLNQERDKLSVDTVAQKIQEENALLGLSSQEREVQIALIQQLDAIKRSSGVAATEEESARLEALIRENQELSVQAQVYDSINGPMQTFLQTQAALNTLLASGAINAQQYAIALGQAKLGVDGLGRSAGEGAAAGLQQIENQLVDVGGTVQTTIVDGFNAAQDALVDFVRTGEFDFSKFVDSILDGLAKLLVQQALLSLLGGPGAAAGAGFFGFGGGGRADGGRVEAGQSYMVGEHNRPERFIPDSAGRIQSASQVDRASSPVVNVTTPAPVVQNIIVRDPSEIPEGINSPAGQDAVLNVIRKNPRAVNQSR